VSHNDWLLAVTSFVFAFGGWLIGNLPGAAIRDRSESDSIDRLGVMGRLAT
jgi:hypothetical protein